MDYATANILTQNQPDKDLVLSIIGKLLWSKEFKDTLREKLQHFNGYQNKARLYKLAKKLVWDELFKKTLTQDMIVSLYWDDEDFTSQLNTCIICFITFDLLSEYRGRFQEEDEGYSTEEYLENDPHEAESDEPENFDKWDLAHERMKGELEQRNHS